MAENPQAQKVYVVNQNGIPVESGGPSSNNSSTATLANGATFTGVGEDVSAYGSVTCAVKTDVSGLLYLEFSPDNSTWDSSLTYKVAAATNEVHRLSVTRQYYRARFTNDSGGGQGYFRLQSMFGMQPPLTSVLSSAVQADADTLIVRPTSYAIDVTKGRYVGTEALNKFGTYNNISTTILPICVGGIYQTPTALTSLEIVSSDANDTSAGTGARTVIISGLGTAWAEVSETVTMNGTTPVALANQYFRVFRAYVVTTGRYATTALGSNIGTLTLRVSGAGATWATIGLVDAIGLGQTQIGCYTVPAGKTLYINEFDVTVDSGKVINFYLFQRPNANTVVAPFGAIRVVRQYDGLVAGVSAIALSIPIFFTEYTDVLFMAETTSGTADVSVQFDGELVTN